MSINITDGFNINYAAPVDYRMVATNSTARLAITYKYNGLKVFQTDNRNTYIWNSTSSSWSIENSDKISGTGSVNRVPKFTGTNSTTGSWELGNSPISASGSNVGINTTDPKGSYTYLQIGGTSTTEDSNWYSGQSLPLTFHKGGTTVIGYNWYSTGLGPAYFDSNSGSSKIVFYQGDIIFSTRPGLGSLINNMVITSGTTSNNFNSVIFTQNMSILDKSAMIRSGLTSHSTQTTPDFTWFNNNTTGIFMPSANTIAFTNNGTESVRINSSGYVGIGNSNPTYSLTVNGVVQGRSVLIKTIGTQSLRVGSSTWSENVHLLTGQITTSNNGFIQVALDSGYSGSDITSAPYNLQIQPGGGNTIIGLGSLVSITPTSSDLFTVTGTASITKVKLSDGVKGSPSLTFASSTGTGIYHQPYDACPDPNTQILLSNDISVRAGDLKVGDLVYTMHEITGIWDNYKVLFVEIIGNQDKLLINFSDGTDISVSKSHKFLMIDNIWKISSNLSIGESIKGIEINKTITSITSIGFGDVVKIEIEHAHTYVSNGVISHNKLGITQESIAFSVGGTNSVDIFSTGLYVTGTLGALGAKTFIIEHPHPSKSTKYNLVHAAIESSRVENLYRGKTKLSNGLSTINLDEHSNMTEGTFVLFNRDPFVMTTSEDSYIRVKGNVSGNILTIESENPSNDSVNWVVISERCDVNVINSFITDDNGRLITEQTKPVNNN